MTSCRASTQYHVDSSVCCCGRTGQDPGSGAAAVQDLGVNPSSVLAIPFVDYARGDGFAVGPDQYEAWSTPCLIDENMSWVRVSWPLGSLHAGPVRGRGCAGRADVQCDGSVRRAWFDPVGWAGLDKVSPRAELPAAVEAQKAALCERQSHLRHEVRNSSPFCAGWTQAAPCATSPTCSVPMWRPWAARGHLTGRRPAPGRDRSQRCPARIARSLWRQHRPWLMGRPRAHIRRAHKPAQRGDLPAGSRPSYGQQSA